MKTAPKAPRRARSPNGVATDKPIAIRLLPEELAKAKSVAEREQRSLASVCRLAMLRGLMEYDRDPRELTAAI